MAANRSTIEQWIINHNWTTQVDQMANDIRGVFYNAMAAANKCDPTYPYAAMVDMFQKKWVCSGAEAGSRATSMASFDTTITVTTNEGKYETVIVVEILD